MFKSYLPFKAHFKCHIFLITLPALSLKAPTSLTTVTWALRTAPALPFSLLSYYSPDLNEWKNEWAHEVTPYWKYNTLRVKSVIHSYLRMLSLMSLAWYARSQLGPTLCFLASYPPPFFFTTCTLLPILGCLLFFWFSMHVFNILLFLHLTNSYSGLKGSTQKWLLLWKLYLLPALSSP